MKNLKAKTQKGFSLVELMVVIAIIAILAAVAIPMYSNYTTRARIGSELSKAGGVKAEVAEDLANGTAPDGGGITMPTGVSLASGSTTTTATINVSTESIVSGSTGLALIGTVNNGAIEWTCQAQSGSTLTASQLPSNCSVAS